jgi:hypothetical protein
MIAIVRMKAQERRDRLWDSVVEQVPTLQEQLGRQGCLLYLSQRAGHKDSSLFVHVTDPDVLGSLIAENLSKLEGLTGCWVITLLRPVFFPLPRDTRELTRCTVTLKVFPSRLEDVYESLPRTDPPPGIMMAYLAYTCHLYGDCLQFSVLADDEPRMKKYLDEKVRTLPGVLQMTVNLIEKTRPLISYEEWQDYSTQHSLVTSWDEAHMIQQFSS